MRTLKLIAVVALIGPALPGCRTSSAREARDFERMRRQQRYDAYDTSAFFADGKVMQGPPAHTLSRGPAFADGATQNATDSQIGAKQYEISCALCHGAGGFGGGPIAPNLADKRPPSLRTKAIADLPADTIAAVITNGIGRMPPLGWQLTPDARDAIAMYVHSISATPPNAATRADSTLASYLHRLDSLSDAGAGLDEILRLRKGTR